MQTGRWVTLHKESLSGGDDRQIVGFMETDPSVAGYKLTRLVVEQKHPDYLTTKRVLYGPPHGPWIINPATVWMVEFMAEGPEGLEEA